MQVFHGTATEFETFDPSESNSGVAAIFFTPDYNLAASYAGGIWGEEQEGRVITASVDLSQAVELSGYDEDGELISLTDLMDEAEATGAPAVWLPDTYGDYSPRSEIAVFDTSLISIICSEAV